MKISTIPLAVCCGLMLAAAACTGTSETLELRLEKGADDGTFAAGHALYPLGCGYGAFAAVYPAATGLPEGYTAEFQSLDFPQTLYAAYRRGAIDRGLTMRMFDAWGRDTTSCSAVDAHLFVGIATGRNAAGEECVRFDTDGDGDFSDERDYTAADGLLWRDLFADAKPEGEPLTVCVRFERIMEGRPVPDSTWVRTVAIGGDRHLESAERTSTAMATREGSFFCSLHSGDTQYTRENCRIFIASPTDTLSYRIGQFIRFGSEWMQADSVTTDGRRLFLRRTPDAEESESTQIGFRIPAFTATDIEGRTLRIPEDFAGKYVLLDFWSLGCGPCRHDIERVYPALYARYRKAGFEIVAVADNTSDELRAYMRDHGAIPWRQIADRDEANGRSVYRRYRIGSFPTLFLIGPDGRVLQSDATGLSDHLDYLLRDNYGLQPEE